MKSVFAGLLLATAMGGAFADDLADAAKAVESGAYPKAVAIYTRLADAGNAQAQFQLGELYWYGEGVPLDRPKGDTLFAKAAAAGNAEAKAATALSGQRAAHLADITRWSTQYNGKDMVSGPFACVAPTAPPVSKTMPEIKAYGVAYDAYVACYNGFVENLASAMPAGKRIPVDIAILMSEQELSQTKRHLDTVYAALARSARQEADQALAQHDTWQSATMAYVKAQNDEADARTRQAKADQAYNARTQSNGFSQGREARATSK